MDKKKKVTLTDTTVDKNKSRGDSITIRKCKIQRKKHQLGQSRSVYINFKNPK